MAKRKAKKKFWNFENPNFFWSLKMASNYAQTVVQAMKMMSNLMMTKIKQRSNWSYYDRKFIINNDLLKTTYLSSSSSFATTSTSIFSSLSLSNLRKFPLYSIIIQNMILMIIMITTMLPLPNSCLLLNTAGMFSFFVCFYSLNFTCKQCYYLFFMLTYKSSFNVYDIHIFFWEKILFISNFSRI